MSRYLGSQWVGGVLALVVLAGEPGLARGDVFNLPHFVAPGEFAIGLEPELTLTSGAGFGANLRYTQGLTDLLNLAGFIGTGSGPRQFRIGTDLAVDVFPDVPGQPGIGIAARAMYIRVPTWDSTVDGDISGQLELTAIPYIHKAIATGPKGEGEVDPFFSMPFGWAFQSGQYQQITTAVVGALIKASEHLRYSMEFGIAVNNTQSYFAGGLTYYH